MELPIDYPTLRMIWWGLLGVLLIAFALTDGFDMGVGALLPFVARTDEERRMVINTIGHVGRQSGVVHHRRRLDLRGLAAGLRRQLLGLLPGHLPGAGGDDPAAGRLQVPLKRADTRWRSFWDWALFTGSFVPVLVFGVAVGNVLQGAPFKLDGDLRSTYHGAFFGLFTPFTLVCGLLSVAMLVLHGAAWLGVKAEAGVVQDRARKFGTGAGIASLLLFLVGGLLATRLGFRIEGAFDPAGPSNPLRMTAVAAPGAWFDNFGRHPWMLIAPVLGFLGAIIALLGLWRRSAPLAFGGSSASAAGDRGHGRPVDVPVHPAQHDRRPVQPDGAERFVQPHDAVHHAAGHGAAAAGRAALHRLGVQGAVGPDQHGRPEDRPGPVLRRFDDVVFHPGSSVSAWRSPSGC